MQLAQAAFGAGDFVPQHGLASVVGAAQPLQAGDGGIGLGPVQQQWVTGGEGFDLVVGQCGIADVLDLAGIEAALHDLADEPGLAFHGLPRIGVER